MTRPAETNTYDIASSDLRERLADVMLDVEGGASVTVTRYGKPVARIVPVEIKRNPFDLADLRARMPDLGKSSVELVREDRDSSY